MDDDFFVENIIIDLSDEVRPPRWNPPDINISMISSCSNDYSKKHLCIGHVMANVFGETLDNLGDPLEDTGDDMGEENEMDEEEEEFNPMGSMFNVIDSLTSSSDNGLLETSMDYIENHATTMYTYLSNIAYVWYINPWGYKKDYEHFEYVKNKSLCFLIDDFLKPVPPLSIEESSRSILPEGIDSIETAFCYYAHMIWYASSNEARDAVAQWNSKFTSSDIIKGHPTTVLFLMTYYKKSDIMVVHPMQSMNSLGPQVSTRDGLNLENPVCMRLITEEVVGACVPWTTIYSVITDKLFDQVPNQEFNHNLVMKIINVVKNQALCGERNAKYLLGKIMFHERVSKLQAFFFGKVYDGIPVSEDDGDLPKSIYMKQIVRAYDTFQELENIESLEKFIRDIDVVGPIGLIGFLKTYQDDDGKGLSQLVNVIMLLAHCKITKFN